MKAKARMLIAGAALTTALGGLVLGAAPASAANWNIPGNITYPFYPQCNTNVNSQGFGTSSCEGQYTVNKGNYQFTEDNTNSCPVLGKLQRITLDYVLNPASGGVTTTKTLAGFSMHW